MRRIAHMQVLPLMSGAQRSMLAILDGLDRTVYEPHVILRGEGPLTEELARRKVDYHVVPNLVRSVNPLRDGLAYRDLTQLFRAEKFSLVHTHSSKPGILGRIAARRCGVPNIVHHVRGFAFHEYSTSIQRSVYGGLERLAGRHCDQVIFVNHEERLWATANGILPADKCVTIYNGVDLEAFCSKRHTMRRARLRNELGAEEGESLIVVAGRIDRQKQSLILPEIATRLERRCRGSRWRILVAGDGPLAGPLERAIESRRIGHRIQLVGWQADPANVFLAGDVILHPTLWEGLPRVLIEAQAAGCASVGSDIAGNREVIAEETGYLCEATDAEDYADRLAQLINDRTLQSRMGVAARRRAETHFDGRVTQQRIESLYEGLYQRASRSDGGHAIPRQRGRKLGRATRRTSDSR